MRMMALVVLGLAACGPSEADDTAVDAAGDALVTGREFNVNCAPERYEVRYANGDADTTVTWVAYIDQPFPWHSVQVRLCNPAGAMPPATMCPAGATCTGEPPLDTYPFCRSSSSFAQLTDGGDRGRINCGVSSEHTPAGGMTTRTGVYYQLAQIHVD